MEFSNDMVCGCCGWRRGQHADLVEEKKDCCPDQKKQNGIIGWLDTKFHPSLVAVTMKEEEEHGRFPWADSEPLFRIGGIYRQNDGELVKLNPPRPGWGKGTAEAVLLRHYGGNGIRRLMDGAYPAMAANPREAAHLIPGEVDEKGNPLKAWPFPLAPTPQGWASPEEYIAACAGLGGAEVKVGEKRVTILEAALASMGKKLYGQTREEVEAMMGPTILPAKPGEDPSARRDRTHPSVAVAGPTPFDPFRGEYNVTHGEEVGHGPSYQKGHPLQRHRDDTPWGQKRVG